MTGEETYGYYIDGSSSDWMGRSLTGYFFSKDVKVVEYADTFPAPVSNFLIRRHPFNKLPALVFMLCILCNSHIPVTSKISYLMIMDWNIRMRPGRGKMFWKLHRR